MMEKLDFQKYGKENLAKHVGSVIKLRPNVQIALTAIKPPAMTPSDCIEAILRYMLDNQLVEVREDFNVADL